MSAFVAGKTSIKDQECLIAALVEMGFSETQIEQHVEPTNLKGYQGDVRDQKAHVIIRKKYVGSISNDIGFLRAEDGTFQTIVSEYDSSKHEGATAWSGHLDSRFGCREGGFATELGARAAAIQAEKAAQKRGMKTKRTVDNTTKKISIQCYR